MKDFTKKRGMFDSKYNTISPFSFKRRLKLLFQVKFGLSLDYPRDIWIEITNRCNIRCVMCPQKAITREKMMMSLNDFKTIIDQVYINKPRILLHVLGEPLLNKNLCTMVKYARSKGCWVGIHTNATLLTEEKSIKILKSGLDYISFSFEYCTPEIYESLRQGAKFRQVKSQIDNFLILCKKNNSHICTRIEIIKMPETEKYISGFIEYWQAKRIDQIAIRPVGSWLGLIGNQDTEDKKKFGNKPCSSLFDQCAILVDGTVVPCCKDAAGRLPLGNIFRQPFFDVWNGSLYRNLREKHLKNTIPKENICYNCYHRECRNKIEQIKQFLLSQLIY